MSFGLVVSIVLHATLLGFALISIAQTAPREPKEPSEPIIADVISASELNRMRKGVREAKLDEAEAKEVKKPDEALKETPKAKPTPPPPPQAAEPPPPPEPSAEPVEVAKAEPPPPPPAPAEPKAEPPKPEPDKAALDQKLEELALQKAEEEQRKAEQAAEAKAQAEAKAKAETEAKAKAEAEAKAKAEAKARAEKLAKEKAAKLARERAAKAAKEKAARIAKEKARLDTNRLSALLDKTPDPKQAPAANDAPERPTTAKGPVRGDTHGRDSTISANEASFLAGLMRQAVSRCWNINAGLDGIQQMVVKIEVHLSPNGDIVGTPRVVNTQPSPVFRDAADSAVRALVQCAPYTLPPDKFAGGWEHMILTFDPARMF